MSMTLIDADICRDGGSLCADFRREDGSMLSVFLEVARPLGRHERARYRDLYVGSEYRYGSRDGPITAKGSAAETALIADLDAWLAASDGVPPEGQPQAIERVRQLREALSHRLDDDAPLERATGLITHAISRFADSSAGMRERARLEGYALDTLYVLLDYFDNVHHAKFADNGGAAESALLAQFLPLRGRLPPHDDGFWLPESADGAAWEKSRQQVRAMIAAAGVRIAYQ